MSPQAPLSPGAAKEPTVPSAFGRATQSEIYRAGISGEKPRVPVDADELERAARTHLSAEAFAYIAGGAGAERTVAANLLRPRHCGGGGCARGAAQHPRRARHHAGPVGSHVHSRRRSVGAARGLTDHRGALPPPDSGVSPRVITDPAPVGWVP